MIDDTTYEKLNDYVDGLLPEPERSAFERALAGNAELRAEMEALRSLRGEAARLPREIAPERDLWPAIESRMGASRLEQEDTVVTFRRRERASQRAAWSYALAAAAMVLVLFGATVMLNRVQAPVNPPTNTLAGQPLLPDDAEFKEVAQQYIEARTQLVALLQERRADIAPETLAVVEENLTVIATAVSEIEVALAKEPQSRKLEQLLYAAYRSEVDLLQQAVQLADESAASNKTDEAKGEDNEAA